MKRFTKLTCSFVIIMIFLSNLQIPTIRDTSGLQISATDEPSGTLAGNNTFISAGSISVAEAVYSDYELMEFDKTWLNAEQVLGDNEYEVNYLGAYTNITTRLNLVTEGHYGSSISWTSTDEAWEWIKPDGTVDRPPYLKGDQYTGLTATISKGTESTEKTFELYIKALKPTADEEAVQADYDWLQYSMLHGMVGDVFIDLHLPLLGEYGSTIEWVSSDETVMKPDGTVIRPSYGSGSRTVTLTATFRKGAAQKTKDFSFSIAPLLPDDAQLVESVKNWLTEERVLDGNAADDVKLDLYLPVLKTESIDNGGFYVDHTINIDWDISNTDVIAQDGTVTRPQPEQTDVPLTLTATISYNEAVEHKVFEFIVTKKEIFSLGLKYNDFSTNADKLQWNGNASAVAFQNREGDNITALQLTDDSSQTGSSIFTKNRLCLGSDLSFSTAFTFTIDHPTYQLGSSRFTFTIQRTGNTTLKLADITPNLSFSIDSVYTKEAGSGQADVYPVNRRISVFYNGDEDATYFNGRSESLYPSGIYNIWVEYDGTAKRLEIRSSLDSRRPKTPIVSLEDFDLEAILRNGNDSLSMEELREVYIGFTGATGIVNEKFKLWDWYYKNDPVPVDFVPYSFTDASSIAVTGNPPGGLPQSTVKAVVTGDSGPVSGVNVDFSATFGLLDSTSVITDSIGSASTTVRTVTSGNAVIRAVAAGGAMASVNIPLSVSDADSAAFDLAWLTETRILGGNPDAGHITEDLYLPVLGQSGSTITWTSDKSYIGTDGQVTTPQPHEGDQTVILEATVLKGSSSLQKTFSLVARVLDEDTVREDKSWLSPERILNGDTLENTALTNVTRDLNLPMAGLYGSAITWTSSEQTVTTTNGTVSRQTYTQGDKEVKLTAAIKKGDVEERAEFTIIVKKLPPTDAELVALDKAWMTDSRVLNGNSSLDYIITNLNLPANGPEGSAIQWACTPEGFIAADGTVTRPAYPIGTKSVLLTATISYGVVTNSRQFQMVIPKLPQTNAEAVAEDAAKLDVFATLGSNKSQYSVTMNLGLPSAGSEGSVISWSSSLPEVISDMGIVIRPQYEVGHQSVVLTATIQKADKQEIRQFEYTVLALPDTTPPWIVSTIPENDASDVLWNTKEVVLVFSEDVMKIKSSGYQYSLGYYGIEHDGPGTPNFVARVQANRLIITSSQEIPAGEHRFVIPENAVTDLSRNPSQRMEFTFTVEQKPANRITAAASSPVEMQRDVPVNSDLFIQFAHSESFNGNEFYKGGGFKGISLYERDKETKVPITTALSGNTITIRPASGTLLPGTVYEMVIPAAAVQDRFINPSTEKTIPFITQGDNIRPEVTDTYPAEQQTDIDINQYLEISFSEAVKAGKTKVRLVDSAGSQVAIVSLMNSPDTITLIPVKPLKPNTLYTVQIPYNAVRNSTGLYMLSDSSFTFTTGQNALGITQISRRTTQADQVSSVDSPIELTFSSNVNPAPDLGVEIFDSEGNSVSFTRDISDQKLVLSPIQNLSPAKTYTVIVPKGAFTGTAGEENDHLRFSFTTAKQLKMSSYGEDCFLVNPSPNWLIGREITFKADNIEQVLTRNKRTVRTWEWSFGDAAASAAKNPSHTYHAEGNYTVRLKVADNYGMTYDFEKTVSIGDYDSANVEIWVQNGWMNEFEHLDVYNQYNPGFYTYTAYLTYDSNYLAGEKIKSYLEKDGVRVTEPGTFTTGKGERRFLDEFGNITSNYGCAFVPLFYTDPELHGTYEMVFEYGTAEASTRKRIPLTITDRRSKQDLNIRLLNQNTGKYVESRTGYYFELDGVQVYAPLEEVNRGEFFYVIDDVPLGDHTLKLVSNNSFTRYSSETEYIINNGADSFEILPVEGKQPGLTRVWSSLSDSKKRFPSILIKGVEMPPIRFHFEGDWDELNPGYYEIMFSKSGNNLISAEPWIDVDPSVLPPDEQLLVRMVSKTGIKSEWMDAKIKAVPLPVANTDMEFRYVNGEYLISMPMDMSDLTGQDNSGMSGMPLLDGLGGFGMFGSNNVFTGKLLDRGGRKLAILEIDAEGSVGKSKKKPKMLVVGHQLDVKIMGSMYLMHDPGSGWELQNGYVTLWGDLYKYYKKGYRVPKIDVGAEGYLSIGASGYTTLIVDKRPESVREYSGILHFEPYVYGSIFAGLSWVSVEGSIDGRIPAEIHIPTGYLQVDPSLTAKITGTFLTYSETLYKKTLTTHWDNGNEKVTLTGFNMGPDRNALEFDTKNTKLAQIPRDYLDQARWYSEGNQILSHASSQTLAAASGFTGFSVEENPRVEVRKENIYPYADMNLTIHGNNLMLLWNDDNPQRNAVNRTQNQYSVFNGVNWQEPETIEDDGTADFTPASASVGDGVLMAWQDINQVLPFDAGLGDAVENAEISVTQSDYRVGEAVDIITLTQDDKFDHSPILAADNNKALLVWTKSEGLSFTLGDDMDEYKAAANSDSLWYSTWDGNSWSNAAAIEGSMPFVVNADLSFRGNEGLLVYTLDHDNDLSTQEDQEIYARIYQDDSWGQAIPVTDNEVPDSNPKVVYGAGKWFITWHHDNSFAWKVGLDGDMETLEPAGTVQDYKLACLEGENPQIALVYQQMGEKSVQTLSALFHDFRSNTWSGEIPLTHGDGYVRSFSPVFTDDGKLKVAFSKAEVIKEVIDGAEYYSPGQITDLCLLSYTPIRDLAFFEEDGLQLSSAMPLAGTTVTVTAEVHNQGDFPEAATIRVYDGIKQKEISVPLIPARSSQTVQMEWNVPSDAADPYEIHAEVISSQNETETDTTNNSVSMRVSMTDIAVTDLKCENIVDNDYLITADLYNRGSKDLEGISIRLENEGNIITEKGIKEMNAGEKAVVRLHISSEGLVPGEDGEIHITLRAVLPDGIEENSTDNNTFEFILEPEQVMVKTATPAQGENGVGITSPLKMTFNKAVKAGSGFDRISLMDDTLRSINISAVIDGETMTITPDMPLDYQTNYTLTLPEAAVVDNLGNSMEDPYSVSFVTTTSSPEVTFAWPGENMKGIPLNTEIKIQYNQAVINSSAFGEIALYNSQHQRINTVVSLQGEWLTIKPAGKLQKDTGYSLIIPRGSVMNLTNEIQQMDFSLSFVTQEEEDENQDGNNDGNDNPHLDADDKKDAPKPAYTITRKTLDSGASKATINLDGQSIEKLIQADEASVLLDLTAQVKEDRTIMVELSVSALEQLAESQKGLAIVTGKGDIHLPAEFITFLLKEGKGAVTIVIEENKEVEADENRVSTGIFDFSIEQEGIPVAEFTPKVNVTMYLDTSAVGNPKRVIACVYDEELGIWKPVGGKANAENGSMTFQAGHFSTYAAFETIKQFDDLAGKWGQEMVEILASRGLFNGKGKNLFAPDHSITRAEVAASLVRSLYTDYSAKNNAGFVDIPEDAWYQEVIQTAYELGLVKGIGNNRFAPDDLITREQLATLVYRLYRYKTGEDPVNEKMVAWLDQQEISAFALEAVQFVTETEIMIGNGGKFEPKRTATRQEAAAVLFRFLEYIGEL